MPDVELRCMCFKMLKGTLSNVSIVVLADPYFCIEDIILHLYRTARWNEGNGRLRALDIVIAVSRCSFIPPVNVVFNLLCLLQ